MKKQHLLFISLLFICILSSSMNLYAQNNFVVSGVVNDDSSVPIPGVSILVKGSTNGTITDVDGKYSINISKGDKLIFSFIGMKSLETEVKSKTLNVTLISNSVGLDEVIVVGYGSQKKINLTGSISTIESSKLSSRPMTNLSSGLSGLAPGVMVTQSSGGLAGKSGATIRIRGIGTMNNSNPLIVVDGIASDNTNIMDDIDPNDVENMSVLKDAASAAIYGSRAANGVILITTKKGCKSDTPVLSYNTYMGFQNITRMIDYVTDFADYMEIANKIWPKNQIYTESDIKEWRDNPNDPLNHPNVNWYKEIYGRTGSLMNHNLSLNGGSNKTQYNLSASFLDQNGIIKGNTLKRYGVRTNIISEIIKGLKIGSNSFFRFSDVNPNSTTLKVDWSPSTPTIKSSDGRWGASQSYGGKSGTNPYAEMENISLKRKEYRILGDLFAECNIIPDLKFTAKVSLDYNHSTENNYYKQYDLWNFNTDQIVESRELSTGGRAVAKQSEDFLLNTNLLAEYGKTIKDHTFKILIGNETQQYKVNSINVTRSQFPNNETTGVNAGFLLSSGGASTPEWSMNSYFSRINYNYKSRYLFEFNLRADGSSKFKKGNRWGYFPSFSVGWNVADEPFMEKLRFVDMFKLRGSWGKLGNNRIGNYDYYPYYKMNQNYSFNGVIESGIAQTALVNEDISWETTTSLDFGFDAAFFKNRLFLTIDYFKKDTRNILATLPVPQFLGAKADPMVNLASMVNKGVEFNVSHMNSINKLGYNVSLNLTILNNKVTDYLQSITTGGIQVGYPYNSFYGYETEGLFKSQEELEGAAKHNAYTSLGDVHIKDQLTVDTDGDGIPDKGNGVIGAEDRVIIGNPIPKFTFGGNFGINYRACDFNIVFQGIAKRDMNTLDVSIVPMSQAGTGVIPQRWVDNEWSESNTNAPLPRMLSDVRGYNNSLSDFWVKDVSYLRIKNIQIGYDFAKELLKRCPLSKMRIYISADNLFTFTNEKWGYDPETGNSGSSLQSLPNVKSIIFGANIVF